LSAHIQAQIRYRAQWVGAARIAEYSARRNGTRLAENTPKSKAQSAV
jgi:hypothetical protein